MQELKEFISNPVSWVAGATIVWLLKYFSKKMEKLVDSQLEKVSKRYREWSKKKKIIRNEKIELEAIKIFSRKDIVPVFLSKKSDALNHQIYLQTSTLITMCSVIIFIIINYNLSKIDEIETFRIVIEYGMILFSLGFIYFQVRAIKIGRIVDFYQDVIRRYEQLLEDKQNKEENI